MRRALTREVYERVLTWFAARYPAPPAYTQCARECGISVDLARRLYLGPAYEEPALHEFQIPMSEVLEKEAAKATALKARQEAEERRQRLAEERQQDQRDASEARAERIKAKAEEQRLLQAARGVGGGIMQTMQDLVPAAIQLAQVARAAVTKEAVNGLSSAEAIGRLKDVTTLYKDLARAVVSLAEQGMKSRGEATQVVEIQAAPPQPQAYGGALADIRRAARLLELAEGTPDLVVETAGEDTPAPAQVSEVS